MSSQDFDKIVAECRERIKSRRVIGGGDPIGQPRFESFHAPSSICSEKVRCVLLYKVTILNGNPPLTPAL